MENMKRNQDQKFDRPQWGFEPRIFEQFPNHNLNFEADYINRAHGSTLSKPATFFFKGVYKNKQSNKQQGTYKIGMNRSC